MDTDNTLSELAQDLVDNNYWASFDRLEPALSSDIRPPNRERRRVIVVVGAGGSLSAGLPLGRVAAGLLIKEMKVDEDELDEDLRALTRVYSLNRDELETKLLALGSTAGRSQKLRRKINEIYKHRFAPVLAYEILAHLMKHRFVDAIINFNFDELLDQSIADELNEDDYYRIISDGDCSPVLDVLGRGTLDHPVYLKPHGTASHKSTLRFTREAYHGLPADIVDVIDHLIRPGAKMNAEFPVTFIIVGFAMQSFEFNELANGAKQGSNVFYINPTFPKPSPSLQPHLSDSAKLVEIGVRSLDDTMAELWTRVAKKCDWHVREIDRHRLITKVLRRQAGDKDYNERDYLQDRFLVELCLSIGKGKGLVSMQELCNDRCGRYFDLWRKHCNGEPGTLFSFCEKMGLKSYAYAGEAFRLTSTTVSPTASIIAPDEFKNECIPTLCVALGGLLTMTGRKRLNENKSEFAQMLLWLYQQREIEFRGRMDPVSKNVFTNPIAIRTERSLDWYTMSLLTTTKWRWILCVAETGEWLTEESIAKAVVKRLEHLDRANRPGHLLLLVADRTHEEKLFKRFGKYLVIRDLPWWKHNRHMTMYVNDDKEPFDAIFFTRRLRATNVSPIRVKNQDAESLLSTFVAYWNLAKGVPWDESQIEKTIAEFKEDHLASAVPAKKRSGTGSDPALKKIGSKLPK